jgi:hypothetical protein
MKPSTNNVLFASLNLPSLNKDHAADEILKLDSSLSIWDDYRNTRLYPLMTKGGGYHGGITGGSNRNKEEFRWVPHAPAIIINWFEEVVFPWAGVRARVMALVTEPGVANYEHIDCRKEELNTLQNKFRIVLKGRTDTLYFITQNGNKHVPNIEGPFIMDGGWPHGMINTTEEVKVTITMGAPWVGNDQYGDDIELLLNRDDYIMPTDVLKYFEER